MNRTARIIAISVATAAVIAVGASTVQAAPALMMNPTGSVSFIFATRTDLLNAPSKQVTVSRAALLSEGLPDPLIPAQPTTSPSPSASPDPAASALPSASPEATTSPPPPSSQTTGTSSPQTTTQPTSAPSASSPSSASENWHHVSMTKMSTASSAPKPAGGIGPALSTTNVVGAQSPVVNDRFAPFQARPRAVISTHPAGISPAALLTAIGTESRAIIAVLSSPTFLGTGLVLLLGLAAAFLQRLGVLRTPLLPRRARSKHRAPGQSRSKRPLANLAALPRRSTYVSAESAHSLWNK